MIVLGILPVVLSFLVLAAHFLRDGHLVLVAVSLFLPVLLFMPNAVVARLLQVVLMAGSLEWLRTMVSIAHERMAEGMPYARSVVILAAVAILTLASAFAFHLPAMRKRYQLQRTPQ